MHSCMYSRRHKVSVPLKKTRCPTAYQRLNPNPSIERAEAIDELERNWREEKRLIDEKSINNRRLKLNGRLEEQKQSSD